MNIDQITNEALQLSSHDRAILAEIIWESIVDPIILNSDISDENAIILARNRDTEIQKGEVAALSHKQLMYNLRNNED